MENHTPKILIVEDESITALDLKIDLEKHGYIVVSTVNNGLDAVLKAEEEKPDLILMDIMLKGQLNGIDAAGIIKEKYNIPVIYLTALKDDETFLHANFTKPAGYIGKPFDKDELRETINTALQNYRIEIYGK